MSDIKVRQHTLIDSVMKDERLRSPVLFLVGCLIYTAIFAVQFDLEKLWHPDAFSNATALLQGMTQPDLSGEFLQRVARLLLESLAIGTLGLTLALVLGIPLALIGARLPLLPDAPSPPSLAGYLFGPLRYLARFLLTIMRSIPELIWAFLFVRILGLGPGPAVLAIGITFGGIIGKLFAELIESCPPQAARNFRARGINPIRIIFYGVLPQIRHQWVGYALFRLECAVRSASILGVVGAGGIGSEIDLSIRYFQYDKLGTALLVVLAAVITLELISLTLRRRPMAQLSILLAVSVLSSFAYLEVYWSKLFSPHAVEQIWTFLEGFTSPTHHLNWLSQAAASMLQTLAMATAATTLAAIMAFFLAPIATTKLAVTGYLDQVKMHEPVIYTLRTLLHSATRLMFQSTRAIPELTWALIFVVWVGAGPLAGTLAIAAHTVGILGRLFGEVYDDIDPKLAKTMEQQGCGGFATWCYGVLPQAVKPALAFTLFRLEVNVRATAMVGFVGAGGIGNDIHTAISLFHFQDLAALLGIMFVTVALIDSLSSALRSRLLRKT